MTDHLTPFRKPSGDLKLTIERGEDGLSASSERLDVVMATAASPAFDVTLTKGARTRRYHIRPGQNLSEWYCQVWFDQAQHRGDRVTGVVSAQRLFAQYRREITTLIEDGWMIPGATTWSDTAPRNQSALRFGADQPVSREATPGALLFEFRRGEVTVRCELRDHGPYGVEAQFFNDGVLMIGRTFGPWLDPTRTTRALAISWADDMRKDIERG